MQEEQAAGGGDLQAERGRLGRGQSASKAPMRLAPQR